MVDVYLSGRQITIDESNKKDSPLAVVYEPRAESLFHKQVSKIRTENQAKVAILYFPMS